MSRNLEKHIADAKTSGNPSVIGLAVVCELLLAEVRDLRSLVTPLDSGRLADPLVPRAHAAAKEGQ